MSLVFVVDAAPGRRALVEHLLLEAGYQVEAFATTKALDIAEQQIPSVMIVAIDLPDGSGISLRQKIREHAVLSSTPVILLADNKRDKYNAIIDSDVDQCVSFPFAPGELVNLVEAALRSTHGHLMSETFADFDLLINPYAMKVFVRGREIKTTALEFRLIDYMARHRGKVFTRDALLDAVWGDLQFVTPRSVDACIRRIRGKIEPIVRSPQFLMTIRGVGYKLEARSRWERGPEVCQCNICSAVRSRTTSAPHQLRGFVTNIPRRAAPLN